MATFALIHGAASDGWSWHLVEPFLRARGHDTVAPDLPCADDTAGLPEYADAVVSAIGDRTGDLVVVGGSLGGFTAPLVCERVPARLMVLVAPMIPAPGESPATFWDTSGYPTDEWGKHEDPFFHDVPPSLKAEIIARDGKQSEARLGEPTPMKAWPDVPTRVLLAREDRVLPAAWVRRLARERLGVTPDEMDGGHCPVFSRPQELAERLMAYL